MLEKTCRVSSRPMAGVYKLDIQESETDLKHLLREQKAAFAKERVQLLYLLKTSQAKTVQQAAKMLGRNRVITFP